MVTVALATTADIYTAMCEKDIFFTYTTVYDAHNAASELRPLIFLYFFHQNKDNFSHWVDIIKKKKKQQ